MTSAQFRVYIAISLDGFIAPADRSAAWLEAFSAEALGFEAFLGSVGPVAMGRRTYDQIRGFGEWPYPGHSCHVLTSRPIEEPPEGVAAVSDIEPLIQELRGGVEDVWLVGGAELIDTFFRARAVDRLELYVLPVLLGEGVSLFRASAGAAPLELSACKDLPGGVAYLEYRVDWEGRGNRPA